MKRVLLLNNQGASYGVPLSDDAIREFRKTFGIKIPVPDVYIDDIVTRDSPALLEIVEKLGDRAFRDCYTRWTIVEVPDNMDWGIAFTDCGDELLYDKRTAIEPKFRKIES